MDGRHAEPLVASARGQFLSPRERAVLELLAQGLTGREIAERLTVSPETVRTHIRNAMAKLEASTRTHAVVTALIGGHIATPPSAAAPID